MAKIIQYQQVLENGGTLTLLPDPDFVNLAIPELQTVDTAQRYDVGTKWEFNGKVYFYAKTAGIVGTNLGAKPKYHQFGSYELIGAAAAAGDTEITMTVDSTDGIGSGTVIKDELKGGSVVIFPAAGAEYTFTRGIVRNDVQASAGGTFHVTLDAPIPKALTTSDYGEICASPWMNIVNGTNTVLDQGLTSCCGIACYYAASGKYVWVQTWGPCWTSPAATTGNADNNQRGVWLQGDGSFASHDNNADSLLGQYAGWVMYNDKGTGQGAPFVYLQIAR
jgi:hypothetical protein